MKELAKNLSAVFVIVILPIIAFSLLVMLKLKISLIMSEGVGASIFTVIISLSFVTYFVTLFIGVIFVLISSYNIKSTDYSNPQLLLATFTIAAIAWLVFVFPFFMVKRTYLCDGYPTL